MVTGDAKQIDVRACSCQPAVRISQCFTCNKIRGVRRRSATQETRPCQSVNVFRCSLYTNCRYRQLSTVSTTSPAPINSMCILNSMAICRS